MDFHVFGHHKGRVETQAKLTDDLIGIFGVFEFLHKFCCAGECNLIDVLFDLFGGHPETFVGDGDGLLFLVESHLHGDVSEFAGVLTKRSQSLDFLRSVYRVGDEFPKENLMVGIEEFLDNRENVLGMDRDRAFFLHGYKSV